MTLWTDTSAQEYFVNEMVRLTTSSEYLICLIIQKPELGGLRNPRYSSCSNLERQEAHVHLLHTVAEAVLSMHHVTVDGANIYIYSLTNCEHCCKGDIELIVSQLYVIPYLPPYLSSAQVTLQLGV